MHQEIRAWVAGSNPSQPVLMGARLVFAADDDSGAEPWSMASMAAAVPYGQGCAGGSGLVPALAATDAPFLANATFGFRLGQTPPGSIALLALDLTRTEQPFGPCTVWVQPTVLLVAVSNPMGVANFVLPIPNDPALLDVRIHAQGLVVDPPSPILNLLSSSNAIEAILGPN